MQHGPRLLREWLDRTQLKQKDLADRLGISDAYLSHILTGYRRPKLELLAQIEYQTGVPIRSWLDTQGGTSENVVEATAE